MTSNFSESSAMQHTSQHPLRPSQSLNKLPGGPLGLDPYRWSFSFYMDYTMPL